MAVVVLDDNNVRRVLANQDVIQAIPGLLATQQQKARASCVPCGKMATTSNSTVAAKQMIGNLTGDKLKLVKKVLGASVLRIIYPAPSGRSVEMTV